MRAVVFAYSNVGDRCLRVLHAGGIDVALVVTHRDRPGETIWFERVADTAAELGLRVVFDDEPGWHNEVEWLAPELMFSFYFRSMLPMALLARATGGAFNLHGSLLPHFRGRAPTNWAVLKGATETGATLHEMTAKPDAGRIVDQEAVPILPDDTGRQVFDKVAVAAEIVLWRSLPAIVAGTIDWQPNDVAAGSYFGGRRPDDGRIDWSRPAREIYDLVRAVAPPYPGAFTEVAGRRLVVAEARRLRDPTSAAASTAPGLHVAHGRIVGVGGDGGWIAIRSLLDGAREVDADGLSALLAGRDNRGTP